MKPKQTRRALVFPAAELRILHQPFACARDSLLLDVIVMIAEWDRGDEFQHIHTIGFIHVLEEAADSLIYAGQLQSSSFDNTTHPSFTPRRGAGGGDRRLRRRSFEKVAFC